MHRVPYAIALILGAVMGIFSGLFGIFGLLLLFVVSYELPAGFGTERLVFLFHEEFPISLMHVGYIIGAVLSIRRFSGDEFFSTALLFVSFGLIVGFVVYGSKKVFASLHRPKLERH